MVKIFSVEGNIGSGKRTIVKYLKDNLNIEGYSIVFLQEPVEIWNTIKDLDGKNIIQHYETLKQFQNKQSEYEEQIISL